MEQQNQAETEEQQEQIENLERSLEEEKSKRQHFEEELARNLQVSLHFLCPKHDGVPKQATHFAIFRTEAKLMVPCPGCCVHSALEYTFSSYKSS